MTQIIETIKNNPKTQKRQNELLIIVRKNQLKLNHKYDKLIY